MTSATGSSRAADAWDPLAAYASLLQRAQADDQVVGVVVFGSRAIGAELTPGSDVDYSTFTTPGGKRLALFQAVIDGKMEFDLLVNGNTLRPSDVKRFEAGAYLVKAYTTDGKPGKYRYRIQFAP